MSISSDWSGSAYRYSAWDGSQAVAPLAPEQVLSALSESLLTGGVEQALDRALHRGLGEADGEQTSGLDHLRNQLRAQRAALDDEVASDQTLSDLEDALASSAATGDPLDAESSRLLDALAASEDAARVLSSLPPSRRALLEDAVRQRQSASAGSDDAEVSPAAEFAGWLSGVLDRKDALDALEQQLRLVRRVDDVTLVDPDLVRQVLGDSAAERFERLASSLRAFAASGHVTTEGRAQRLSARALQHIGDELLAETFRRLTLRGAGDRRAANPGHHDLTGASRDYQFGDPLTLDLSRTVMSAVRRGLGTPVRMRLEDFAIFEREETARAATVLALDLSRSMGERGYLLAAKRLALAIHTLVRTRFPRDHVQLVCFSDTARPLSPAELPQLSWDRFGLGTNVQDALRLGRELLAAHRGARRNLILLTDGEPTAHRDADGSIHFAHPTTPETLARCYAEADRLRRDGIDLWVCVLSSDMQVVAFAETLARAAAGELIVTDPDDLAEALVLRYGASRR